MTHAARRRNLKLLVSDAELARIRRLAAEDGEPVSVMLRRWVNEAYRSRFGADGLTATSGASGV